MGAINSELLHTGSCDAKLLLFFHNTTDKVSFRICINLWQYALSKIYIRIPFNDSWFKGMVLLFQLL